MLIALVVLLVVAAGLGIWWWSLRSNTDPIDAAPVDAYAVVTSSPACPGDGITKIEIERPGSTAAASQVSGCGYRTGGRIAVQYLSGHPEQARIATGNAPSTGASARKWLPMGILFAGVLAVAATIVLLAGQRRSRHGEAGASQLTVAQLRAGMQDGRTPEAGPPAGVPDGGRPRTGAETDPAAPPGNAAESNPESSPESDAERSGPAAEKPDSSPIADPPDPPSVADDASITLPRTVIDAADRQPAPPAEPADLFTHRGHDLSEHKDG